MTRSVDARISNQSQYVSGINGEFDMAIALPSLARVLNAASELTVVSDMDDQVKRSVAFVREGIGLERVVVFWTDLTPTHLRLRGAWAVGADGTVVSAQALRHECGASEYLALVRTRRESTPWKYYERIHERQVPSFERRDGERWWVVATPLMVGGRLVGVLYNGNAMPTQMDQAKQVQVATLCRCLEMWLLPFHHRLAWHASEHPGPYSKLVARMLAVIAETPTMRCSTMASAFGRSAGHLARQFKREVGVSLVEYRQRLLIERFVSAYRGGQVRLVDAALEAGFGSYAQFHRVYTKCMGTTPRESVVYASHSRARAAQIGAPS